MAFQNILTVLHNVTWPSYIIKGKVGIGMWRGGNDNAYELEWMWMYPERTIEWSQPTEKIVYTTKLFLKEGSTNRISRMTKGRREKAIKWSNQKYEKALTETWTSEEPEGHELLEMLSWEA